MTAQAAVQAAIALKGRHLHGRDTLALLMALTATSQLGVSLFLPALPIIGRNTGMAAENVTLIISTYLIGLAAGQLVVGPLSDRLGRRRLLLLGLLVFTLAGIGAAFAQNAEALLLLRVVQGAAASAPLALGLAVARDLYGGPALLRVTALITMAAAVVPGLAPALGGVLTESIGWRGAFGFAAAVGGVVLLFVALRLPETNASPGISLSSGDVLKSYGSLSNKPAFARNALSNALMLSAFYAFLAGAPLALIGPTGLTPVQFGFVPLATSSFFLLGGWMVLRSADHPSGRSWALVIAWGAALAGASILVGFALMSTLETFSTVVGASLFGLGLGALLPGGVADALAPVGKQAGTASALLGALNMVGGALAGAIVGWTSEFAAAFPAVMFVCVLGAFFTAPRARRGWERRS